MKKRIRLGQPFLFLIMTFCFLTLPAVVIIFGKEDENLMGDLIVAISFCIISLLILSFSDNFGYYMEMKQDRVYVKALFFTKSEYLKTETILKYGVYVVQGRSGKMWAPCLVIGKIHPNVILFSEETTGSKKLFREEYFLVLLTKNRLKKILKYFNQKIQLPQNEAWEELYQSAGMYAKDLRKFYVTIEKYNSEIDV